MYDKSNEKITDEKFAKAVQDEKIFFHHLIKAAIHQLRSPLASINITSHVFEEILQKILDAYKNAVENKLIEPAVSNVQFKLAETAVADMRKAALNAQHFLTCFSTYIENYIINPKTAETHSIKDCLEKLLKEYPFESEKERLLVHIDVKHDFNFKAPAVFINDLLAGLLKNALFYIKQAGKGEITIWTETENEWNIFHFKDTGLGIRDENLPHVFDHFFSKRGNEPKAGLGFCKEALRAFGGSMVCDSQEGEYTHFIIKFPVI